LFPEPARQPLRLSGHYENLAGAKASYTDYKTIKRVQCDECVWVLHLNKGVGDPPRTARYKRSTTGGQMVLCWEHMKIWRELDGK
jgi:hypothetical protein